MDSQKITFNQAIFCLMLFNYGSTVVIGFSSVLAQDNWIALILAAIIAVPVFLMYGRILKLYPEKDFFDIAGILLGKVGGKIVSALFVVYSLLLAALVLRNFAEFTEISFLEKTPKLPIMICTVLTSIYLARSGMRTVGKWSVVMIVPVIFVTVWTLLGSIKQMRIGQILPVMDHPFKTIANVAFETFSFPFAETVLFLCLGGALSRDNKHYKMFLLALTYTVLTFLAIFFRNITLLGREMMRDTFFPSFVAVRILEMGDFFARVEGSVSSNFLLAGVAKITICLLAAAKGMNALFNLGDHKPMVLPCGILALGLAPNLFKNAMEMFENLPYYPYYSFPFQVIIPFIIWIAGEIHSRRHKAANKAPIPETS